MNDTQVGPLASKLYPDRTSDVMQNCTVRPAIPVYAGELIVTAPRELVRPERVVDPVMPDTVHTPTTLTDESTAPLAPTTVTVTEPLILLFDTFLTIVSDPTFIVARLETVIDRSFEAVRPRPSLTVIVNMNVPPTDGVPEITPADERLSPSGRAPRVTDHTFVPEPPVAASVAE